MAMSIVPAPYHMFTPTHELFIDDLGGIVPIGVNVHALLHDRIRPTRIRGPPGTMPLRGQFTLSQDSCPPYTCKAPRWRRTVRDS